MSTNHEPRWRYTGGLAMDMEPVSALERAAEDMDPAWGVPLTASDQCIHASETFVRLLREYGYTGALRIVSGFQYVEWGDRKKILTQGHTAVRVGSGEVWDWTARQFDPDAGFPQIMTIEEWQAAWPGFASERDESTIP